MQRMQGIDTSDIHTHHPSIPPIFVVQVQLPSEPPTSMFSSAEDGPGWAIVMYFKITEVRVSWMCASLGISTCAHSFCVVVSAGHV